VVKREKTEKEIFGVRSRILTLALKAIKKMKNRTTLKIQTNKYRWEPAHCQHALEAVGGGGGEFRYGGGRGSGVLGEDVEGDLPGGRHRGALAHDPQPSPRGPERR